MRPNKRARAEDDGISKSKIRQILRDYGRSFALHPYKFMISWNGVLVLAFRGFSRSVIQLKSMLNSSDILVKENPGSMWPKCSLGCLKDRQNITQEQLRQLSGICESYNSRLFGGDLVDFNDTFRDNPENILPWLLPLQVQEVHITVYECRSHERILLNEGISLPDTNTNTNTNANESGNISSDSTYNRKSNEIRQSVSIDEEEKARVHEIYAETLDVDTYFVHASKAGHKETHYREGLAGSSLVLWLRNNEFSSEFSKYSGHAITWVDPMEEIRKICTEIETALPGLYTFFDMNSLHVTLRAVT